MCVSYYTVATHTYSYELTDWFHSQRANKAADIHHQRYDGNEVLRREKGHLYLNFNTDISLTCIMSYTTHCMNTHCKALPLVTSVSW